MKQKIYLILSIIGIGISFYLLYGKLTGNALVCNVGNCWAVQNSPYAVFLGIPVAVWGLLYYFVLFTLLYLRHKFVGMWLIWGILFSSYLTYLEFFVIKDVCQWCMLSFLIIIVISIMKGFKK